MEKEVLQKGQVVYVIGCDLLEPITLGEIEKCISYGYTSSHYLIKGYDGNEYHMSYPSYFKEGYFIATRLEYKELLENIKKENDETIDKLTKDNKKIEVQFSEYQSCDNNQHEFGEWEALTYYVGNDIHAKINEHGCSYTVGEPNIRWVRRCKCCGFVERTTDKTIVESSRVRGK